MGRPSTFNREAAVETVMQEIWQNGYEANSVKAMSEKLGITRSSFYNSFGSREELFKEVLATYFNQTPDRALYGDPPDMPVLALISKTFREIVAIRAFDPDKRGCMAVNCVSELVGHHEDLGPMLGTAVKNSAARFEELLNIAVERRELPQDIDTHGKALALQNLLVGLNVFAKVLNEEGELWLMVRTTLEGLGIYQEVADADV
jgi:TetR/AcrR family transcriptional repressor of nem operon